MSLMRFTMGMALFMVVLNLVAYVFAQNMPGSVISINPQGAYEEYNSVFGSREQNATTSINQSNAFGFVVDAVQAVTNLNLLIQTLFGGETLQSLLHLPQGSATLINIVQGVIYTMALFTFFAGRGD